MDLHSPLPLNPEDYLNYIVKFEEDPMTIEEIAKMVGLQPNQISNIRYMQGGMYLGDIAQID